MKFTGLIIVVVAVSSCTSIKKDASVAVGRNWVRMVTVYVRSGPDLEAKIVQKLPLGMSVDVERIDGMWCLIGPGQWVLVDHLTPHSDLRDRPGPIKPDPFPDVDRALLPGRG